MGVAWIRFYGGERCSKSRVDGEELKKVRRDARAVDTLRITAAGAIEIDAFKANDLLKGLCLPCPLVKVGVGDGYSLAD